MQRPFRHSLVARISVVNIKSNVSKVRGECHMILLHYAIREKSLSPAGPPYRAVSNRYFFQLVCCCSQRNKFGVNPGRQIPDQISNLLQATKFAN